MLINRYLFDIAATARTMEARDSAKNNCASHRVHVRKALSL